MIDFNIQIGNIFKTFILMIYIIQQFHFYDYKH